MKIDFNLILSIDHPARLDFIQSRLTSAATQLVRLLAPGALLFAIGLNCDLIVDLKKKTGGDLGDDPDVWLKIWL